MTRRQAAAGALGVVLAAAGAPALAHHPGHDLDKVMGSREQFFEAVDKEAPGFALEDAAARPVSLADLRGKVVVLSFLYTGCPDVCPLHAEKIAEIQGLIAKTPMREVVQFVGITTDPANDTPDILRDYGPAHGLDAANWAFLTAPGGAPDDTTRRLAEAYGLKFTATPDGYQMHAVVTHVIDQEGRLRARFHGLRFDPVNLVTYVNGLINQRHAPKRGSVPGVWDTLRKLF